MKTIIFLAMLASVAVTAQAMAQTSPDPAELLSNLDAKELSQKATGRSFQVDGASFRLAPSVDMQEKGSSRSTAANPPSRTKRSMPDPASSPDAATGKLAAALSGNGAAVVVTSRVNVFFTDVGAVATAAQATGGKVVHVSRPAGQATVEYPSVNAALDASPRLLSHAGIRAAEPEVVQWKEEVK